MPTLLILELGREPRLATFTEKGVRIGRDETNDLILPGKGVSREHGLLYQTEDTHAWMIYCASEKNPIVVDGAMLRGDAELQEGSEILVGNETLLIFNSNETRARSQMGARGHYGQTRCEVCGWTGMISKMRKQPVCPSCSSLSLQSMDTYDHHEAVSGADDSVTEFIDNKALKASLQKLKTAKRSRIERIDGKETLQQSAELSEKAPLFIRSKGESAFELSGLIIGQGVEISWSGSRFMIKSALTFPALKINGAKVKVAPLDSGDVIEIGNNRFKLVVG